MTLTSKFTSVLVVLVLAIESAQAQSAREVAKKTFPSVVIILMEDKNGQLSSLGSGFLVEEGIVASNFHVVEGASGGLVKLLGDNTKYEIQGVISADETNDLVLLGVANLKAPALSLGNSDDLAIGDELYAVGNPRGLEGTFSQGIVSGIRKLETGSLIQITAPISPGSSGGPILDSKGKVIGVAVATYKGGQNLNFAIPINSLRGLLASKHETKPLTTLLKRTSERSILKDLGPRNTAGIVARKAEWDKTNLKFSVLNQLRQPVRDASFIVIFYDDEDSPIEFRLVTVAKIIPAGLATWSDELNIDYSTCRYCSPSWRQFVTAFPNVPKLPKEGRVEIRVLGFNLVEE